MAIVYSYLRFSSKKQERGDSLRRQTELAAEWVQQSGHSLADLTLRDLGVSAFRGKHKHRGALKTFLNAVEEKIVPAGSILLIEHLDRLSREGVSDAFTLFNDLLRAGIKITVLKPSERSYTKESISDLVGLLEPLMHFHLAHEESLKKSQRLKAHWNQRRKNAKERPLSRRCPSWIKWDETNSQFVVNPEAAKAVQFIFEKTIDGFGHRRLLTLLNKLHAPIGHSGKWNTSFIEKVLNDRAVLGELQPKSFDAEGQRQPEGAPIPNYYPAIIDEGTFFRAKQSATSRRKHKGPRKDFVNPFAGLVFSAIDKSTMYIQTTRTRRKNGALYVQRRLVSYSKMQKLEGADDLSFDYYAFEQGILAFLHEVTLSDLQPISVSTVDPLADLERELSVVQGRLSELEALLTESDQPASRLLEAIDRLESKEADLLESISKEKEGRSQEHPLEEAQSLLEGLTEDSKLKLRSVLPRLLQSIHLHLWSPGKRRVVATAQITFSNGWTRWITMDRDAAWCFGFDFMSDVLSLDLRTCTLEELNKLAGNRERWWKMLNSKEPSIRFRPGYHLKGSRDEG
jgi:DNA invertase Pin-like site-specific DNA recombinase